MLAGKSYKVITGLIKPAPVGLVSIRDLNKRSLDGVSYGLWLIQDVIKVAMLLIAASRFVSKSDGAL